MSKSWALKTIIAKRETTYGTDPTPTGAADAMDAHDVSFTPLAGGTASRQPARPYFRGPEEFPVGSHCAIEFSVPLISGGAAGTAPPWAPLIRACGFGETVTAATKVDYKPVSTGFDSCTIYFNNDGVQTKLLGSRGNVVIKAGANGIPELRFSFLGKYAPAADVTMPTLTLTAWPLPTPISDAATPTFLLHGFNRNMEAFELNAGRVVNFRALVNSEEVQIRGGDPRGSCSVTQVAAATVDWAAIANAATQSTLQLIHGATAGSIIELLANKCQIMNPQYGDSEGDTMVNMDLALKPTSGDDDFTLTAK